MRTVDTPTGMPYTALVVVSPMRLGDDQKNQDRARWSGPGQVADVCDGVTSSPNASEAATLVASLIPAVFQGDVHERLNMLSDTLTLLRHEHQDAPVVFAEGTPPPMQELMAKVVREKRATGFQTTLVAAKLTTDDKMVMAHVLRCGDSAFFAFTSDGELLTSSLAYPSSWCGPDGSADRAAACFPNTKTIRFGPGDQILVRVEGRLSQYARLQELAGIKTQYACNWLVCTPVDGCPDDEDHGEATPADLKTLLLTTADRLLVPDYLWGKTLSCAGQQYRILWYSSTARPIYSLLAPVSMNTIVKHGSATRVLPDHFYSGGFDSFEDRFRLQTHFLLCSDGFYSGFSTWGQLWAWLHSHATVLHHEGERAAVLEQLHADLNAKSGDDDMSFVWVYPAQEVPSKAIQTARSEEPQEGGESCRQKL